MKNSSKCSKCGGADVVRVPGELSGFGGGNWVRVGFSVYHNVKVSRYVCIDCGFVEEWVDNREGLKRIAGKWAKRRS